MGGSTCLCVNRTPLSIPQLLGHKILFLFVFVAYPDIISRLCRRSWYQRTRGRFAYPALVSAVAMSGSYDPMQQLPPPTVFAVEGIWPVHLCWLSPTRALMLEFEPGCEFEFKVPRSTSRSGDCEKIKPQCNQKHWKGSHIERRKQTCVQLQSDLCPRSLRSFLHWTRNFEVSVTDPYLRSK